MAAHISDYTKDSANILLDLVNEQNGTTLTVEKVALSITGTGDAKPTVVTATSVRGSGYRGSVNMNYNRVLLGEIPNITSNVVGFDADTVTLAEVLEDINARYGVNISEAEVSFNGGLTDPIALEHDRVDNVDFSATGNKSVVWVGSCALQLTRLSQALSDTWGVTTLDGLYPPGAGSPAEDLVTYAYTYEYYGVQPANNGEFGKCMSAAKNAKVVVVGAFTGASPASEHGYITILQKTDGPWDIVQTITMPMEQWTDSGMAVQQFGRVAALSDNGLVLAVSSSQNTHGDGGNTQMSIVFYTRASLAEDFTLVSVIDISEHETQPYYLNAGRRDTIAFINNSTVVFGFSGVEGDEWNTYVRALTVDLDTGVGTLSNSIATPDIGADNGTYVSTGQNSVLLLSLMSGYSNSTQTLNNSANYVTFVFSAGTLAMTGTDISNTTVGCAQSADGLTQLTVNGEIHTRSSVMTDAWEFQQNLFTQVPKEDLKAFGAAGAVFYDGDQKLAIISKYKAADSGNDQGYITIFRKEGNAYVYNSRMTPEFGPDVAIRELHFLAANGVGSTVFASQLSYGTFGDAYYTGVVHQWDPKA